MITFKKQFSQQALVIKFSLCLTTSMFVILCGILLFGVTNAGVFENTQSKVAPYDLEDEVRDQVEALETTVRSAISSSFRSLDNLVREVYSFRDASITEANLSIQQEYETLDGQLTTIKDLAQAAGQDINICLETNEPLLNQLPDNIIASLRDCLAFANQELTIILNDARYRIDTTMNDARVFYFQIDSCRGDFLCISPIVTKIELAMIEIPQKIGVEVERAADLYDDLKVSIGQCTDQKAAQFATEGSLILNDIATCVNNM
jgi:hypothetical protein